MEKSAKKLLLRHFSHEHLLEHTRESLPPKGCCCSICFGCKREILPGKQYYRCKTCPFYLHQFCYNIPQKIQHPVDPNHNLILLSMPSSSNNIGQNSIKCKACQQNINNVFYYSCGICGNFFHALCLSAPLSVKLPVNIHSHTLGLEFSPPYDFQCDLCDEPSHRGWLYRCSLCEFDAHISCALMEAKNQIVSETEISSESFQEIIIIPLSGDDKTTPNYQFTPSYQFSDAYFSIDLTKSFPKGFEGRDDVMQINPTFDVSRSPSQKDQNLVISSSVAGSNVWVEIGQENSRSTLKASTQKSKSVSSNFFFFFLCCRFHLFFLSQVRCRCSCW